jgi:hypothetical protein
LALGLESVNKRNKTRVIDDNRHGYKLRQEQNIKKMIASQSKSLFEKLGQLF